MTDQKMNFKSNSEDTSKIWIQVRTKIGRIVKDNYSNLVLIAGCFGNLKGNDLDIFIVFKEQDINNVLNFQREIKHEIIEPFLKSKIKLIPFRYATSKHFLPFMSQNTKEEYSEMLPIHFLIFPDLKALLEWEDHEIIMHILNDLESSGEIWIGENQVDNIKSLLKPIDFLKRKTYYEELLFSALQDATLEVLEGSKVIAAEKAAYAVRYLSQDDAVSRFGFSPNSKDDIIEFMISQGHVGSELLSAEKKIIVDLPQLILSTFNYWRPNYPIKRNSKLKRLETIKDSCSNLSSPVLIFDELQVEENIKSISTAFSIFKCPVEICYAIKANSIIPLVQFISDMSYGGLCATSYSDLATLRKVTLNPKLVNVHLSFPSEDLLLEAINNQYRVIVSDEITSQKIVELHKNNLINIETLSIFIRVKPEVTNRIGYHRFGITENNIGDILHFFRINDITVNGLSVHANAASTDPILWAKSLAIIKRLIDNVWYDYFSYAPSIIVGGGFASSQTLDSWGVSINMFSAEANKIFNDTELTSIVVEPGRFIVGDAGIVYTQIKGIKPAKTFDGSTLIVDAGSNFLIPLDSSDYSFYELTTKKRENKSKPSFIIADSWSSFGIHGRSTELAPNKKVGDYILIGNAGAYTYSMASNSGDGIPSYRFMNKLKEERELLYSRHFVQNEKYLNAKYELDKPLLHNVINRIKDLLDNNKEIQVLDIGCGIGHYLQHLINCEFDKKFKKINYIGVDISTEMIKNGKKKWREYNNRNININFKEGSISNLSKTLDKRNFDLVVGLSLMEYIKDDLSLHKLIQMIKPGGLLHLPVNYDGVTQFEPTFNRELEEIIIKLFNQQLIPNPYCGRMLYNKIKIENLDIIDFRVDDWVILPSPSSRTGQEYSTSQEFFLETLISTIDGLKTHNLISQAEKNEWVNLRLTQLKRRELIFICRQCSVLARR